MNNKALNKLLYIEAQKGPTLQIREAMIKAMRLSQLKKFPQQLGKPQLNTIRGSDPLKKMEKIIVAGNLVNIPNSIIPNSKKQNAQTFSILQKGLKINNYRQIGLRAANISGNYNWYPGRGYEKAHNFQRSGHNSGLIGRGLEKHQTWHMINSNFYSSMKEQKKYLPGQNIDIETMDQFGNYKRIKMFGVKSLGRNRPNRKWNRKWLTEE
ncbi:MAG: hypothetical protein AABY07_10795 [Nanoarchaeota archaeon]